MSPHLRWSRPIGSTLLITALACSDAPSSAADVTPGPDSVLVTAAATPALRVDTLARGLVIPWGVAVAPDGRIFVTERAGRLRVITAAGLRPEPLMTLTVHAEDPGWHPESGLMGIALAPDFATTGHAYVAATVVRDPAPTEPGFVTRVRNRLGIGGTTAADALPFENQVIRITIGDSTAGDPVVVARGMWTNHYHAGGALAFGPDGKLYTTVGDGRRPHLAQTEAPVGKLFRLEADGRVPADNPTSGSTVFATGLRNTQALTWLADGTLLGVEHGPSGIDEGLRRTGRDELNVLVAGGNYGWPKAYGWEGAGTFTAPLWVWGRSVAPAGLVAYAGPYTAWQGNLFVGRLRGGVERLVLARQGDAWTVAAHEVLALPPLGRVRTVALDHDGALLLTTSNRDVRGTAGPSDDLVLRVRPPSPTP